MRSVNHRFADLRLRVPGDFSSWERTLREKILARVKRGRVEATVTVDLDGGGANAPRLDRELLQEVLRAAEQLRTETGVQGELDLQALLSIPGMFKGAPPAVAEIEGVAEALDRAADGAVQALDEERCREGEHLCVDLRAMLGRISATVTEIRGIATSLPPKLQEKVVERLKNLAPQIELDPARVAQEAAILAERADVTEELVRLEGHVSQAGALLEQEAGDPVGKRLDFLVQEILRETNTINSKSANLEISRAAIELKAELEKVREQIQNLE